MTPQTETTPAEVPDQTPPDGWFRIRPRYGGSWSQTYAKDNPGELHDQAHAAALAFLTAKGHRIGRAG